MNLSRHVNTFAQLMLAYYGERVIRSPLTQVISKRTGANKYIAYFQAYTNTCADVRELSRLYDEALKVPDVIGLDVGTRPDCVPDKVPGLLAQYQQQAYQVWLELGLQSAFDAKLNRVSIDRVNTKHERGCV